MSNPPSHHNPDPSSFLMGGSVPSASFLKIGAGVTGTICEPPTVQQQRDMQTSAPKNWDDGSPMLQLVVTLQTGERDPAIEDDDGRRRIYIKHNMKKAVAEAVKKAGSKALEEGGKLTVTYTKNGQPTQKGFSPPKYYEAVYVPPADAYLDSPDEDEGFGEPAAPPSLMTLDEAVLYAATVGITREQLVKQLKAGGFGKWNGPQCTPFVVSMVSAKKGGSLAKANVENEELDDSQVPF